LTAFVSFAFEEFQVWDPTCSRSRADFSLWVTYGGALNSGAIYCCPGEVGARSVAVPYPVVDDKTLRDFRSLLIKERDTVVHATLVGHLLVKPSADQSFGGYGHMGCCSMFVIEQVESFEAHTRKDLDYSSTAGDGEGRQLPCKGGGTHMDLKNPDGTVHYGVGFNGGTQFIREQAAADSGERSWAFTAPARVALEAVQREHGNAAQSLKRTKAKRGRQVFEWEHDRKLTTVVVTRPSWLASYAKTDQVAWIATAMETAQCDARRDPPLP
jgi:hypothetical protein